MPNDASGPPAALDAGTPLVHIVEDTDIQAKKLKFYLEKYGYRVLWSVNGVEALKQFETELPSLIITDVQMPEMDGLELLARVRENDRTRHIPVIVLTTLMEEPVRLQALEHGASDFLTKPFHPEELKLRARNLVTLAVYENLLLTENFQLNQDLVQKNRMLEENLAELKKAHEQLKLAQGALVQSSKLSSFKVLGAGIAHEINNPLAIIAANSDLIADHLAESAVNLSSVAQINQKIGKSVQRIAKIVDHVRVYTHGSDDRSRSEPLDLNAVLVGLQDFYREYTISGDIEVSLNLCADALIVKANVVALEHAFLNLIHNALDAMKQSEVRKFSICSERREGLAIVKISDTGGGIPPEHIEQIFDPFFTTKLPGHGTGLGLFVTRAYLHDYGATIRVNSSSAGTVFTVEFHLLKE